MATDAECRGTWHYRFSGDATGVHKVDDRDDLCGCAEDGEHWRYCGPHPSDDIPEASSVETIEWFACVTAHDDVRVVSIYEAKGTAHVSSSTARRSGYRSHVVRVLLPLPPDEPPIATVTGEVSGE